MCIDAHTYQPARPNNTDSTGNTTATQRGLQCNEQTLLLRACWLAGCNKHKPLMLAGPTHYVNHETWLLSLLVAVTATSSTRVYIFT
jgi:hypothetical protein